MHEASLVASLLNQIDELVVQNGGGRVTRIRVEVGPLAGVETPLLVEAFRRLRNGASVSDAELVIDAVPLTCSCRRCRLEYQSDDLQFVCPACGCNAVDVTSGDSIMLHSLTLSQPVGITP